MIKVITYGTYDYLHYGHIKLLERAKALGDYLIVGVTSDDFDINRGKINVQQSLMERVEAVRATGIADEIIIEEYEGQKIDDIRRLGVDVFTVGSDWEGHFDYLNEYCQVVYLPRTEGISSTEIRSKERLINTGIIGDVQFVEKYIRECQEVNGLNLIGVCTNNGAIKSNLCSNLAIYDNYNKLLDHVNAVIIVSHPEDHYSQIKKALQQNIHVLCEAPIALSKIQESELFELANKRNLILLEAIKTAYATAYHRLLIMIRSGAIGNVISIETTCTSMSEIENNHDKNYCMWNSMCAWGPTALLPIFQLLGTEYKEKSIVSLNKDNDSTFDLFSNITIRYNNAIAIARIGKGVKSEGELIISGTKGYAYVPAPWWKTDYFELKYEDSDKNKRFFYQLDGEGIKLMLVDFLRQINSVTHYLNISREVSISIVTVIEDYYKGKDVNYIIK